MYVEETWSSRKLSTVDMTLLIGLSYADAIVSYFYVKLVFAFIPVYVFGKYN